MDSSIFRLLHYFVLLYPSCMAILTFSGFFAAVVALILGDRRPYEEGFISLNPLAHLNIVGLTILFAVLFFLYSLLGADALTTTLFAWIAVFSIRYAYPLPMSHHSHMVRGIVILSEILGYMILALLVKYALAYVPFESFSAPVQKSFIQILHMIGSLALATAIMQMMPLYPLSMGRALIYFFPNTIGEFFQSLEEYSIFILIGFFTIIDIFFPQFFIIGMTYLDHVLSKLVF